MPSLLDLISIVEGIEDATVDQQLTAWQELVDTGMINHLQGWYGRTARQLIEQGLLSPPA
jgi:hypothetical protein